MNIKCNNCKASKKIKETLGCNIDQVFNRKEILKQEILKSFKIKYVPKFQCRFEDLIHEKGE